MKTKVTLVIIALVMAITPSFAADRVFSSLRNLPGVEITYIGPAALRLAGRSPLADADFALASAVMKDIESIEIVECENPESIPQLEAFTQNLMNELHLEPLVEDESKGEINRIYAMVPQKGEESGSLGNLLIESVEPGSYELVFVKGAIDLNAMMKAAEEDDESKK